MTSGDLPYWPFESGQFGRVTWSGYTDMGRIRIPPLPKNIGMTDRADGKTVWYLTHNVANAGPDGNGYISLTSTQPKPDRDWVIFGPYDGPVIPGDATHPNIKLFISSSLDGNIRIGYDTDLEEIDQMELQSGALIDYGRVYTRRGVASETRLIYRGTWWTPNHVFGATAKSDELPWTPVTFP